MKYWILKANPRENDPFEEWIVSGSSSKWRTGRRAPKDFAKGDKLVIWESAPGCRVIAFANLEEPPAEEKIDGSYVRIAIATSTSVRQFLSLQQLKVRRKKGEAKP